MARAFYIEEIGLVIFTMFNHRKVQTVSVERYKLCPNCVNFTMFSELCPFLL